MDSHDERGELDLVQILQFVDRDEHRRLIMTRGFSNCYEQVGKVRREIAAIGEATFRIDV